MTNSNPIVPLKCQECEAQFLPQDGGICATCGRLLCSRHFPHQRRVCRQCANAVAGDVPAQPVAAPKWTRREVAHWAKQRLAGTLSYEQFLELVPEDTEDEDVSELISLIEHEPKRGGLLGARRSDYERHRARMHQLIEILGA